MVCIFSDRRATTRCTPARDGDRRPSSILLSAWLLGTIGIQPIDAQAGAEIRIIDTRTQGSTVFASPFAAPLPLASGSVTDLFVDTENRTEVLSFYNCAYQASEGFDDRMDWIGDLTECSAGSVSADFHDDTLRRINYYRAMSGLEADISFDPVKNAKSQEAALIMARNSGLSHHPIVEHPDWQCLTSDGDEAAGKSNLSLGSGPFYTGPAAVDGQMQDAGSGNVAVGHRRWLLYSQASTMGNGGIPGQDSYGSASSIWVIGDFEPPAELPSFTSWPNAGFVPYPVVYPRWSFSVPGSDLDSFDSAVVTMSLDGANVPVVIVHPTTASSAASYGDPTIVWEPQGLPGDVPAEDLTYQVTISGVTGTAQSAYTYEVTIIDPANLGEEVVVLGPVVPGIGIENPYRFNAIEDAAAYELRVRQYTDSNWLEGAEEAPPPSIIDGTSSSYDVLTDALSRTGARAFHLAFPDFVEQWFEVGHEVVPGNSSTLEFHYLRRFSHIDNRFSAEVSADDGVSWTPVWGTSGICSGSCSSADWDPAWTPVSVPLDAWAGQSLRLRFFFAREGPLYLGTTANNGIFVDDVQVTASQELVDSSVTNLPASASGFTLTPGGAATYLMDMRAEVGCRSFPFGPVTTVTAAEFADNDGDGDSDVTDPDDDNDQMPDGYEIDNELDPFDPTDAGIDSDKDGYSNLEELEAWTDPRDPRSNPRAKRLQLYLRTIQSAV